MVINIKRIPNYITLIRIIGTILLLFQDSLSLNFFILYFLCGLSDILDGYVARKLRITSKFGARLDSIADMFFIISVLTKILPNLKLQLWMIFWIVFISAIKLLSFIIGYLKFHEVAFLHTYSNKFTGIFLFFTPLIYNLFGLNISVSSVCSIATLAAFEELLIILKVKNLDLNIRGIYKIL